jgi:heat shock protein HspQ
MTNAKFSIGQLIRHKLFDYRGVIADVDPFFQGTDEWYEQMALTRPPKDKPWYRVLVDKAIHETYVAERNLEPDVSIQPVHHPLIDVVFDGFVDGSYTPQQRSN